LEFACPVTLLGRLSLQGLDPCSLLTDLHVKPGKHILGLNLRLPIPLNLT
jgi:hypothetical protein